MPTRKPDYNTDSVEIISRENVYKGFFKMEKIRLRHKLFAGGWSEEISRELFVRGDAVGAVLYDPILDKIGLVEQFRIGALREPQGPWCLEVVAGMIEVGESPEQVVTREVKEEANLVPDQLEYICYYLSSPGGSDERLYLYCCICDLSTAGGIHGLDHEHEDIRVCVFNADEVFDALLVGRFNNAATLICLQWLQWNRGRLREVYNKTHKK